MTKTKSKPKKKSAPEINAKRRIQVIVSGEEYLSILRAALERDRLASGETDEPIPFTPRSISAYCAEKILGRPSSLRGRGRPKNKKGAIGPVTIQRGEG